MRISRMTIAGALLTALALSGCGGGEPATSGAAGDGGEETVDTIGFSVSTMQNPYFVAMEEGVREQAEKEGVEVIVADAGDDAQKQANDVQNFISQGVDAVILNPTDGDAIVPTVAALNEAGIPVLTVDRTANGGEVVTHIGTDNVTAGEAAARTLFESMGGEGDVVVLEGVPGASPTRDRGEGFQNVVSETEGVEIVASQTANFQRSEGLSVTQNLLQSNPDIGGILAMNDEMALGAIEALRSANKLGDVQVIGIDGGDDAIEAVREGNLVATIAQQPKAMGELVVENAVQIAQGEDVPEDQPVDIIVIDEEEAANRS